MTAASVEAICTYLGSLRLLDIRAQQGAAGTISTAQISVIGGQSVVDRLISGPERPDNYRTRLLQWQQSEDGVFVKKGISCTD